MSNHDNRELHVIFGTGPVGMAVMDELIARGRTVRLVNRRGRANVHRLRRDRGNCRCGIGKDGSCFSQYGL